MVGKRNGKGKGKEERSTYGSANARCKLKGAK
jgi:hypothetical protein